MVNGVLCISCLANCLKHLFVSKATASQEQIEENIRILSDKLSTVSIYQFYFQLVLISPYENIVFRVDKFFLFHLLLFSECLYLYKI